MINTVRAGSAPGVHFSTVPAPNIRRSRFDRSSMLTTTFQFGNIVPVYCDEVLPGDTFQWDFKTLIRLTTLVAPSMVNLYLDLHAFFVPCRLVWENWERFFGAQDDPSDSIDFIIPTLDISDGDLFLSQSLADYLELPVGVAWGTDNDRPSALPFRAYSLIYNQWYRDENIQDSQIVPLDDGPDDPSIYPVLLRGLRKDYFWSALVAPQKGDAVTIPLGSSAPVVGTGVLGLDTGSDLAGLNWGGLFPGALTGYENWLSTSNYGAPVGTFSTAPLSYTSGPVGFGVGVTTDPTKSGLVADLNLATAATINSLRQAFVMQQILELNARGGTRYTEFLQMHFGVINEDYRLQRSEFLGGATSLVTVAPVVQTSETGSTPQGTLVSYGVGSGRLQGIKSFTEHGYFFVMACTRGEQSYQNMFARMWTRKTRFDFWDPLFEGLGEQSLLNQELSFNGDNSVDSDVFGYQERGAEYRFRPSTVSGKMRTSFYNTGFPGLDSWTIVFDYSAEIPTLSPFYLTNQPPIDRILAVVESDGPSFRADFVRGLLATRAMPVYSVPGLTRL